MKTHVPCSLCVGNKYTLSSQKFDEVMGDQTGISTLTNIVVTVHFTCIPLFVDLSRDE